MTERSTATAPPTVWTIGHSTHPWPAFLELLAAHHIGAIADVRRFPGSRRFPWFASETLAAALPQAGVGYAWIPALGGRRKALPGSPNGAWDNAAFQGYADHMRSSEFAGGLHELLAMAAQSRTAVMCAEAPWWRCHRRLVSDLLVHRGHEVLHILGPGPAKMHPLNEMARADGADLLYPPPQGQLFGTV